MKTTSLISHTIYWSYRLIAFTRLIRIIQPSKCDTSQTLPLSYVAKTWCCGIFSLFVDDSGTFSQNAVMHEIERKEDSHIIQWTAVVEKTDQMIYNTSSLIDVNRVLTPEPFAIADVIFPPLSSWTKWASYDLPLYFRLEEHDNFRSSHDLTHFSLIIRDGLYVKITGFHWCTRSRHGEVYRMYNRLWLTARDPTM